VNQQWTLTVNIVLLRSPLLAASHDLNAVIMTCEPDLYGAPLLVLDNSFIHASEEFRPVHQFWKSFGTLAVTRTMHV
jgi:hypothetical protein